MRFRMEPTGEPRLRPRRDGSAGPARIAKEAAQKFASEARDLARRLGQMADEIEADPDGALADEWSAMKGEGIWLDLLRERFLAYRHYTRALGQTIAEQRDA